MRAHLELLTLAALSFCLLALAHASAHAGGFRDGQRTVSRYRDAEARALEPLTADFRAVGAAWPPKGLYLRAFKLEGVVELWAAPQRGERWVPVRTFDICMPSGGLGPKLQEGDLQVPEGFYEVQSFNPHSNYHLGLMVSYPNATDRARAAAQHVPPGGGIMIHGKCVTIGCLPLRDGPIEALYVATVHARDNGVGKLPVHIYPCRFETEMCRNTLVQMPEHADFWAGLAAVDAQFRATGKPPNPATVVKAHAGGA